MYIDNSVDVLKEMKASTEHFQNAYDEAKYLLHEMQQMTYNQPNRDVEKFDAMALRYVCIWGEAYNKIANEEIQKAKDIKKVPENIFRSASPKYARKKVKFGNKMLTIISFKEKDVAEGEVVYTLDELNWLKSNKIWNDKKGMEILNSVKEVFPGSYIQTDFDKIMGNIQSKGAMVHEGDRFHKTITKLPGSEISRVLRMPLEEQQRYASRPARS